MSITIREMADEAYNNSRAHGFHDQPMHIPEKLMLIVSEAAEAMECDRNGEMFVAYEHEDDEQKFTSSYPTWNGKLGKPVGFLSELADIIIRIGDLAGALGLSKELEEVLIKKMEYNRTRPVKHGGKKY